MDGESPRCDFRCFDGDDSAVCVFLSRGRGCVNGWVKEEGRERIIVELGFVKRYIFVLLRFCGIALARVRVWLRLG